MRISDWSSDVCSSDLRTTGVAATTPATVPAAATALWVPRSLEKTPVETASTTSTTARTMISTLDFTRQPSPGSAFSAPAPPQATWSDRRGKVEAVPLEFREAGLGDNAVDYLDAWEMQGRVHAGVAAG